MYKSKLSLGIAAASAVAALSFSANSSAIIGYSQDFETLSGAAAGWDGWKISAFVSDGYTTDLSGNPITYPGNAKFNYGPFDANNSTAGFGTQFSGIPTDVDGSGNSNTYLVTYSDYDCCAPGEDTEGHFDDGGGQGDPIEFPSTYIDPSAVDVVNTIVFKEFVLDSTDVGAGNEVTFSFKARLAQPDESQNLTHIGSNAACQSNTFDYKGCTANAFLKTIDASGNATNTLKLDMGPGNLDASEFATFTITLDLSDPALVGQKLQIGFDNYAGDFGNTGVNYDDISLQHSGTNIPIPPLAIALFGGLLGLTGLTALRKRTKG